MSLSDSVKEDDILEPLGDALHLVQISLERSMLHDDESISELLTSAVYDLADTIELVKVPTTEQSRSAVLSLVAPNAN